MTEFEELLSILTEQSAKIVLPNRAAFVAVRDKFRSLQYFPPGTDFTHLKLLKMEIVFLDSSHILCCLGGKPYHD